MVIKHQHIECDNMDKDKKGGKTPKQLNPCLDKKTLS